MTAPAQSRSARRTPAEIALDVALVAAGLLSAALLVSVLLRALVPQWGGFGRENARKAELVVHERQAEEAGDVAGATAAGKAESGSPGQSHAPRGGVGASGEIKAQVLNGCGVAGAGAAMASVLRRAGGIDVVEIGNADDFDFESSVVIDRRGDRASAMRVARALGGAPVVLQRSDGCCEVTVIVGYDRGRWLDPLQGGSGP
jgi:hypothetical protein